MSARLDRIVLDGRHVRLEPLAREHARPLHEAASASRRTYGLTLVPDTEARMVAYVDNLLAEEERGEALPFAVKHPDGTVVGATRFLTIEWWKWDLFPPVEPLPVGPDALEIGGTWYAERVQRTALNTEAKLLLCTHAFETLRVRRVTLKTDARNDRSRAAILRIGARFEGVLRAHRPAFDGAVRDTAFYSLLSSEWPEAKRALEGRLASRRSQ